MAGTATRRRAAKPAPPPEPVEDEFDDAEDMEEMEDSDAAEVEDDDDDLEELEDSEDETEGDAKADKPKRKPPTRPKIEFGSPELAAHVTEVTGESYSSRDIRMLLRKLAKDGKLNREIGVDRARYEFSGPNDPTVKLVVKMVKDGTAKELKRAGLDKVKENAAAKKAAAKAAKAAEAEDDAEDMEEVEEAPAKKTTTRRRTTTAAKSAPAKATATRRRTAAK